jgi:hypothetical protein
MSVPRAIELVSGIATTLGQIAAVVILVVREFSEKNVAISVLVLLFLFLLPGLVVFVGTYAHVVDAKSYGRPLLAVGALLVCGMGLLQLVAAILYPYSLGVVSVLLLPSFTALVAFVAAFAFGTNRPKNPQRSIS